MTAAWSTSIPATEHSFEDSFGQAVPDDVDPAFTSRGDPTPAHRSG
jgi:hypothetical protein